MSSKERRLPGRNLTVKKKEAVKKPCFAIKTGPLGVVGSGTTIVISKTAVKNATQRNFIRRQIRNILNQNVNKHKKIVVLVGSGVVALTKKEIREEFSLALKKIS